MASSVRRLDPVQTFTAPSTAKYTQDTLTPSAIALDCNANFTQDKCFEGEKYGIIILRPNLPSLRFVIEFLRICISILNVENANNYILCHANELNPV